MKRSIVPSIYAIILNVRKKTRNGVGLIEHQREQIKESYSTFFYKYVFGVQHIVIFVLH